MKNYPNQASSFERIRNTLQTIADLNKLQANTLDDGVLGYELATRGFYTFRGIDYVFARPQDIADRITEERQKPAQSQGARTNARELRRTLQNLGWVDDQGVVNSAGQSLLATQPGSQAEVSLLADGLVRLEVPDQGGTRISHPVLIMLRLLDRAPSPHRAGLELMLEANDDSPGELSRVLGLYSTFVNLPPDQRAQRLHISPSKLANAIKVFPTLAKYAGLITEDARGTFHIAPPGLQAINAAPPALPPAQPPAQLQVSQSAIPKPSTPSRRPQTGIRNLTKGQQRAAGQIASHGVNRTVPSALTPDQQAEAQNRLLERTVDHQNLVRYFAQQLDDGNSVFYEDQASYDLVWMRNGDTTCHLFEMKTVQGDADHQIIRAIGQLNYYRHFNVAAQFGLRPATKTVVVDVDLHVDLAVFLQVMGIGAIKATVGQQLVALNSLGQELLDLLH